MQKYQSFALYIRSLSAIFTFLCLPQFSFCQAHTSLQSTSVSSSYACSNGYTNRQQVEKCEAAHDNHCGQKPVVWETSLQTDLNYNNPLRRNYAEEQKAELRYIEYEVCRRSQQAYTNRSNTKLNTLDTNVKAYMNNDFIGYFKPGSVLFADANEKVDVIIANKRGKAIIYAEDADGLDLGKLRKGRYDVYVFNKNKELLRWQRIKKS